MYKINELPTPCFVIDEGKLEENLKMKPSQFQKEYFANLKYLKKMLFSLNII